MLLSDRTADYKDTFWKKKNEMSYYILCSNKLMKRYNSKAHRWVDLPYNMYDYMYCSPRKFINFYINKSGHFLYIIYLILMCILVLWNSFQIYVHSFAARNRKRQNTSSWGKQIPYRCNKMNYKTSYLNIYVYIFNR